jgi:o-succinylbenzoate synthase
MVAYRQNCSKRRWVVGEEGHMQIESMSVFSIPLALNEPLRTATGTHDTRHAVLVRAQSGGKSGWGENVAPVGDFYLGENAGASVSVMIEQMLPRIVASDGIVPEDVSALLADIDGFNMAKFAVEMAVTDLWLRHQFRSLAAYVGAIRTRITAGVVMGLYDTQADLERMTDYFLSLGYTRIKLKIAPGQDIDVVRTVRNRVGADFTLQVDANGAYTPDDTAHLSQLDEFNLQFIEQPFSAEAIKEHAELASRISTPICLDESIVTLHDLDHAIAAKACSFVNIKPARVGSIFTAVEMCKRSVAKGVTPWCGGMLESGVGRAALLAFAALPDFTITHDISASHRYFQYDVTSPFEIEEGQLRVPQGLGIGVIPWKEEIETAEQLAHVTR